ncbi:hypothetical protein OHA98_05305 [Streptomyces sp. NBC_00654]|uniref:hypothetical protein n=1 Tax=Streptomyces sp. NBC_00654 TaxID=2975799 RepID=UPI0022584126|nr:hypothetical protein [Streptomyces sp. NBC_00654]MCX4964240.1 hypothetical protein [Streptomyces sp. NBC_00654]
MLAQRLYGQARAPACALRYGVTTRYDRTWARNVRHFAPRWLPTVIEGWRNCVRPASRDPDRMANGRARPLDCPDRDTPEIPSPVLA